MANKNSKSYLGNLAKSFGYIAGDIFEEYNPVVTSIAKQTKEIAQETYSNIKDFKFKAQNPSEKSLTGDNIKSTIKNSFNNMKSDIISGKIYNKDRDNLADQELAKSLGFDFDFSDDDWGDFDDEDSQSSSASAIAESNKLSAKEIVGGFDVVGSKISSSIGEATAETGEYIANVSRENSKALYSLNQKGFTQINSSLLALNTNLASFAKIGEPLSAHMQNSTTFFSKATESLNNIEAKLDKIIANTAPTEKKTRKASKNSLSAITDDGLLDLSAYKDMVVNNIKSMTGLGSGGDSLPLNIIKGFFGLGGSNGKNTSLMKTISVEVTKKLIPKVLKESMKDFNDSLKYALTGGLVKLKNKSTGNPIIDLIKDLFLPQDQYKSHLSTGNYEKGKVDFDGYTKKSIVEVIPQTLSMILSTLQGTSDMMVYDYENGKFVRKSSISNKYNSDKLNAARRMGGDFRSDIFSSIDRTKSTADKKNRMKAELDAFLQYVHAVGPVSPKDKNFSSVCKALDLSKETIDLIKKSSKGSEFYANSALARDEWGNMQRYKEDTGIDTELSLFNNSSKFISGNKSIISGAIDEYNHNNLFYLRGIYKFTAHLANNIPYLARRSKKINYKYLSGLDNESGSIERTSSSKEFINNIKENRKGSINTYYTGIDASEYHSVDTSGDVVEDSIKNDPLYKENKKKLDKNTIIKKLKSFAKAPAQGVSNLLNSISVSLNRLIWGKDANNPEDGIFGVLIKGAKKAANSINESIKKIFNVDLKKKIKDIFSDFFGEKKEDLKKQTKESFKEFGNWFVGGSSDSIGKTKEVKINDNGNASRGRQVTKSGIVSVSEGEMIIPSYMNPYYHKLTNHNAQKRNEIINRNKFFGCYADGTVNVNTGEPIDEESNPIKDKYKESKEKVKSIAKTGVDTLTQGFKELGEGLQNVAAALKGKDVNNLTPNDKKLRKNMQQTVASLFGDAKGNKGALAAGAILGAGGSLLTGGIIGPIFGASIGASIGFMAKSKTVQEILFGKDVTDKDGNVVHKKGVLPDKVAKFLKDNGASTAKGAMVGSVGGLFMGSPVLGAILGSAVGFVKSSDKAKEFLFGKYDEEGKTIRKGLIPKPLQDKLKKAAPRMAIGSLAGLVVGPFGIVGNLMVGAGLGFVTSSNKFKTFMFGDPNNKEDKGLLGKIHDLVLKPLNEFNHNFMNMVKAEVRNIGKAAKDRVAKFIANRTKKFRAGIIKKIGKGAGKLGMGLLGFEGRMLAGGISRINQKRKARNLYSGYQVWNPEEKRNMNAAERFEAMGGIGSANKNQKNIYYGLNQAMMGASDKELNQMEEYFNNIKNPNLAYKQGRKKVINNVYGTLSPFGNDKISRKDKNRILKNIDKGDLNSAISIVNNSNLSDDEKSNIINNLNEQHKNLSDYKDSKLVKKNSEANIKRMLKTKGVNFTGDIKEDDTNNILDLIKNEKSLSKQGRTGQFDPTDENSYRKGMIDYMSAINNKLAILAHVTEPDPVNSSKIVGGKDNISTESLNNPDNNISSIDMLGDTIEQKTNEDGNLEPDVRDKETRESIKKLNTFYGSVTSIPILGKGIGAISKASSSIKEAIIGSKKKKKSGLMGLLSKGFGKEGLLANFLTLFTGGTVGGSILPGLKGMSIATILKKLAGSSAVVMAIAGLFGGLFDGIANKLSGGEYGAPDSETVTTSSDGRTIVQNKEGKWVYKDTGEEVPAQKLNVTKGDADTLSTKFKKAEVRGLLTNHRTLADKALGKTSLGKGVKKVLKNKTGEESVTKALAKGGSKLKEKFINKANKSAFRINQKKAGRGILNTKGAIIKKSAKKVASSSGGVVIKKGLQIEQSVSKTPVIEKIVENVKKVLTRLGKIPILSKLKPALQNIGDDIAERVLKGSAKIATKITTKVISDVFLIIDIVSIPVYFFNGYSDANTTFKISGNPTTAQKIISGCIRAAKNCIPGFNLIGSIIPDALFVDIFINYLAPALGVSVDEIKKQREDTKKEVEDYNQSHGTKLSTEQYLKQVKHKYSISEKISNKFKTGKARIKQNGGGIKGTVKTAGQAVSGAAKKAGKFAKGVASKGIGVATEGLKTAGQAVSNVAGKVIGIASKPFKSVANMAAEAWKIMQSDGYAKSDHPFKYLLSYKSKEEKENPYSGFVKSAQAMVRLNVAGIAFIRWIGRKLIVEPLNKHVVQPVRKFAQVFGKDASTTWSLAKGGHPIKMWSTWSMKENGTDGPLAWTTTVADATQKIYATPVALMAALGGKIKGAIGSISKAIKSSMNSSSDLNAKIWSLAKGGHPIKMWGNWGEKKPAGILGWASIAGTTIQKIYATPVALMAALGGKIKGAINRISKAVQGSLSSTSEIHNEIYRYAKSGHPVKMWSVSVKKDNKNNPVGFLGKALAVTSKLVYTGPALFHMVGRAIKSGVQKIASNNSENIESFNSALSSIKSYSKSGDLKGIMSVTYESKKSTGMGAMLSAFFTISKTVSLVTGTFNAVVNGLGDIAGDIKDKIGDTWDKFKNLFTSATHEEATSGGSSGLTRYRGRGASTKPSAQVKAVTSKMDRGGRLYNTVNDDAFVSQYDPKYSGMRLGGKTVKEIGCGPAVASTLAQSYGRKLSMKDAVKDSSRYVNNSGTSINYFTDELAKYGISSHISTGADAGQKAAMGLGNNESVILLGQDKSNKSKESSPFGPNPHYVVATGFNKNGKVIIKDPEMGAAKAYNPKILNSTKAVVETINGIGAGSTLPEYIDYRGGGGKWDPNGYNKEAAKTLWAYFTNNGFSEAATAGILGNAYQESSISPSMHDKYAGGIFQWENYTNKNQRFGSLLNFAKKRGKSWTDARTQGEFVKHELSNGSIDLYFRKNTGYSNWKEFAKETSPTKAAEGFEKAYERAGKPMMQNRTSAAKHLYELFSGKKFKDVESESTVSTSGATGSSDSSTENSNDVLSNLSTIFSNAFGKIGLGGTSEDTSSSSSSSSASSSADTGTVGEGGGKNAEDMIKLASSQIGYKQGPGKSTKYGAFTGVNHAAWCASFVSWVFSKAFGEKKAKKLLRGNKSAAVSGLWDNFKKHNATTSTPKPGDVIIYKNGMSHTGIVSSVNTKKKTFNSIEGNTSDYDTTNQANGGVVAAHKNRGYGPSNKWKYLTTFGRPDWSALSGGSSGLLLNSDFRKYSSDTSINTNNSMRISRNSGTMYRAGASQLMDYITKYGNSNGGNTINVQNIASTSNNMDQAIIKILAAIVDVLSSISVNTGILGNIYKVLENNYGSDVAKSTITEAATSSSDEIDPSIKKLAGQLAAIAKG